MDLLKTLIQPVKLTTRIKQTHSLDFTHPRKFWDPFMKPNKIYCPKPSGLTVSVLGSQWSCDLPARLQYSFWCAVKNTCSWSWGLRAPTFRGGGYGPRSRLHATRHTVAEPSCSWGPHMASGVGWGGVRCIEVNTILICLRSLNSL